MQFLSVINFTAAIQGFFLAYLLINRRYDGKESRILALLLITMSLAIMGSVLGLSGYYRRLPHLIRVADPLTFLFGPLLYFYFWQITRKKLPARLPLHFIPFIVYVFVAIPFYLLPTSEKLKYAEEMFIRQTKVELVLIIQTIRTVHVTIYVFLCLSLLREFRTVTEQNYSEADKFRLNRAVVLLRLFIVLLLTAFVVYLGSLAGQINLLITNSIISLGMAAVIYGLAYATWNTIIPSTLYFPAPEQERSSVTEDRSRNTYNLSDEHFRRLSAELNVLLDENKLYLESEFSLTELSNELGIQPYLASELISRHYRSSFFEVVNKYRIEEVKRRLTDPAFNDYSILGIALECGFNSKSSFNSAFKKHTGLTPSSYRDSCSA